MPASATANSSRLSPKISSSSRSRSVFMVVALGLLLLELPFSLQRDREFTRWNLLGLLLKRMQDHHTPPRGIEEQDSNRILSLDTYFVQPLAEGLREWLSMEESFLQCLDCCVGV